MLPLREIEQTILAIGRVDGPELETLRRLVYAGGKIERREADFLVELHKRLQHHTPAFEKFFYQAIKDHILADGRIDAEEAAWLRQMLFADGKIDDEERKFLHELKGEADQVEPRIRDAVRGVHEAAAGAADVWVESFHEAVQNRLLQRPYSFPRQIHGTPHDHRGRQRGGCLRAHRTNEVIVIYPITPSSPTAEWCDEWSANGRANVWGPIPDVTEMQSEAGVIAAIHGALPQHGPAYVSQVRDDLARWLEEHEFESLRQMQGSMSLLRCRDPGAYQRANYIRLLQSWNAD